MVAALTVAAAAPAQNLLINPDFDAGLGLSTWASRTGSWVLGSDSGSCSLSDSASGTSDLAGGGSQFLGIYSQQCIPVDPVATPTLHLGVLYRTPANVFARLVLAFYSDAGCLTPAGFSSFVFDTTSADWKRLLGPVALAGNAQAVQVWADFNPAQAGLPQYTGSFDRFYLGVPALLFADSFEAESGSTCHWSVVVGGV